MGTDTSVFTRAGCARVVRYAFALARERAARHPVCVTKSNALRHGMVLWDEVFDGVAQNYPDLTTERVLVDAMTARMVTDPSSIDTVVATNLHADIQSDLAAALTRSLGLAPTANLHPKRRFPSMFEPIHGSGHDIAGQGSPNPVGALWSAALLLSNLGESAAGDRLVRAIERALAHGVRAPDLGGNAGTRDMAEAVKQALAQRDDQGTTS